MALFTLPSDTPETAPQPTRVNLLIGLAILTVIGCGALTVWSLVDDDFAKATITLILGRFLGYVDNIYSYEFGTTRASVKKDAAITELTKTAAVTAQTAALANSPLGTGNGGEPAKIDTLNVQSKTTNVDTGGTK